MAGTTAPLQQVVEAALVDPEHRLWTGHHVVPGRYVLESNAGPAGEVLTWFARTMFPGDPQCEARLFSEARDSELGAAGLLPIELTNQGIERALTVGLMIAFLLGSFWLARLVLIALWGRVRVIVTRASLIREIDYPIQSVLRLWPFLPARLRTQQIPLTDIQTVRTNTKQERIEIHGRGKILRLHMQGAKTDELKWAAKLVRSALKLLVVGIPLRQGAVEA